MRFTRADIVNLRSWARAFFGGYKHTFEIQTWNGSMDTSTLTDDGRDAADVDHLDLTGALELPDNAVLDIQVWGRDICKHAEHNKIGWIDAEVKDGKITRVRIGDGAHNNLWHDWA